ncbi:hypothetical protein Tco_0624280 [Tanacetum coccineum]|uniref:Retrovirus-related Pol polyprotein from transposon TNT 1-94 n=1 Tax=Tanacetum coccineum TaxID=301880 RepID=A0ABQ4WDK3_9ASTR
MARQCTKPKRPINSEWFKEKAILAEALESGVKLDEEQMAFLAYNGDTITITPSASVVLMAKLSSDDSEYSEQLVFHNDTNINISNDSNMISYEQYLKETETTVVQDTSSYAQQDAMIMSVIEEMTNQVAKCNEESTAKEDKYLEEIIELEKKKKALDNVVYKIALGYQNPLYLSQAQRKVPTLYCGNTIIRHHDALFVIDTKEILELVEKSRLKMHAKQNDPIVKEKKVNIAPINYVALNKLSEYFVKNFSPQKQLSAEQAFWLPISKLVSELPPVQSEERKFFEIKEKELLLENDRLLELLISQDLVHTVVNFLAEIIDYQKPLSPELLRNKEAHVVYLKHTQENTNTLREIFEQARELRPLDRDLDSACKFIKRIQKLLVYVSATCLCLIKPSEKLIAVTSINKNKKVRFEKPTTSSSNTHKQVDSCKTKDSNKPLLPSTGVTNSTSASGSKPPYNTKQNRISQPTSSKKKNKVEYHLRSVKPSLNKKNHVSKPICNENVKHSILNANSKLICATYSECMFDAIHDLCVLDYLNNVNMRVKSRSGKSKKKKVWKPTGKVYTNVGYSWKPTGRTFTIDGNTCL